ncbi:MAG: hypothetical protein ACXVB9_19630 [Bdellovibrionota bacterium]
MKLAILGLLLAVSAQAKTYECTETEKSKNDFEANVKVKLTVDGKDSIHLAFTPAVKKGPKPGSSDAKHIKKFKDDSQYQYEMEKAYFHDDDYVYVDKKLIDDGKSGNLNVSSYNSEIDCDQSNDKECGWGPAGYFHCE